MHHSRLRVAIALAMLLVLTACGGGDLSSAEAGEMAEPSWGPLAVIAPEKGDDLALIGGILRFTDQCVQLETQGGEMVLLVWDSAQVIWNAVSTTISFTTSAGAVVELEDGNAVTMSGGGINISEDGQTTDQFLGSIDFISAPSRSCVTDTRWFVSDVVDNVARNEIRGLDPEGPIGGGQASGTGVDADLVCPPGIPEDQTEWFGPAGLTIEGAVTEAFGDLIVGWMGKPFEIETNAQWSSWGLLDQSGNLVALVTLAANGAGWDPSHARFCVMPQPTAPPPPFTLHVSNQSFENPSVQITITIDDEVVVDQNFAVEGQHNWITFEPDLEPGDHVLTARSNTGAELSVSFTTEPGQPRWAVVDYWWYPNEGPRKFTFRIEDEPIYFM